MKSKEINYAGVEFVRGGRYNATGRVTLGLDMGHSGESADSSYYSMQIYEHIGETSLWLNGKRWKPTEDTKIIKQDILDWWSFYNPDYAYGDALKADMIADLNDMLYLERLINVDRHQYAENSAANWKQWSFAPIWNTGQTKWAGATFLQQKLRLGNLIIPYFSTDDDRPIAQACRSLIANFKNVKEGKGNARYGLLEPIKGIIGDDDFDASWMAILCANDKIPAIVDLSNLGKSNRTTIMQPCQTSIVSELQMDLHKRLNITRDFV